MVSRRSRRGTAQQSVSWARVPTARAQAPDKVTCRCITLWEDSLLVTSLTPPTRNGVKWHHAEQMEAWRPANGGRANGGRADGGMEARLPHVAHPAVGPQKLKALNHPPPWPPWPPPAA